MKKQTYRILRRLNGEKLDFPLSMAAHVDAAEAGRVSDALELAVVWVGRTELGINEDHVTGSAHTTLGPYWALETAKLGKNALEAYQASARGGQITVRVDNSAGRVYLRGGVVLVMAGTLLNTFCV
ncbi:hypothetical protein R1sor_012201 [Riccia sorocarpa]|uniref:Uncharacterized protein n=1 Tax=Riccia sorocarpa TaxID=122646 RepID=A0ABD3I6Q4_9MARC